MAETVIELRKLTKFYGKSRGVLEVDLQIRRGEIFGFLGPNGAGKSTTINMLLDIIRPSSGEIILFGRPNTGDTSLVRRDIAWLAGDMELYGTLTGRQYITLAGRISGSWSAKRMHDLAKRLNANLDRKIHALSRGNRQKIGLIAALARDTKLLILDEPTSGLDPLMQQQFRELMEGYRRQGGTVFISSHVLSEVQTLCDRVAFIREGKIVDKGTLVELLSDVPKRVTIKAVPEVVQKIATLQKVKSTDGHVAFDIKGNPGPVLAKLPLDKIDDITVASPELEEIFMTFYQGDKKEAER